MPKFGNTSWFTCVICHKMYSHKNNLKRHIKSVHENIRHHCQWCAGVFKRKEYLTRHIRNSHPGKLGSSPTSHQDSALLRSTSTQTDSCRLAFSPTVQHVGTNTKFCLSKDKSVGTTTRTREQATSPIQWGCHSLEAQIQEEVTQATASYQTAPADDWALDPPTVEEYFTHHCPPHQDTLDISSDELTLENIDESLILDFDLDMFD